MLVHRAVGALVVRCQDGKDNAGASHAKKVRRLGRPAWKRSPDDTPLRDGNRDRIQGMLTTAAVKTLLAYTTETNQQLHHWLRRFSHENEIPMVGCWEDVSGDTFLRKLLQGELTSQGHQGMEALFDHTTPIAVDPANLAMRIMDIRTVLAKEWIDDLQQVAEDNGQLLKASLLASLELEAPAGVETLTETETLAEMEQAELQSALMQRLKDLETRDEDDPTPLA